MTKTSTSLAALALALCSGTACAADLSAAKAPPPPPPVSWTGFYVGVNAGAQIEGTGSIAAPAADLFDDAAGGSSLKTPTSFGVATAASVAPLSAVLSSPTFGFIGGGQVGFNWKLGPSDGFVSSDPFYGSRPNYLLSNIVLGVEADIQGSLLSSNGSSIAGAANEATTNAVVATAAAYAKGADYLGTLRARAGVLATPTLLAYLTGGLAYGEVSFTNTLATISTSPIYGPSAVSARYSDLRAGWTIGGGFEWKFWDHWSAKLEYLYYDLGTAYAPAALAGSDRVNGAPLYAVAVNSSTKFDGHIVRAGLNYNFTALSPPPVVAAKF